MATVAGFLGFAALDGLGSVAKPYTVPTGQKAAVTVSLCNGGATPVRVRAGYLTALADALADGRWLLGGVLGKPIPAGETVQFTTMLGPGQAIGANSDAVGVTITVNGIQEPL